MVKTSPLQLAVGSCAPIMQRRLGGVRRYYNMGTNGIGKTFSLEHMSLRASGDQDTYHMLSGAAVRP